MDIESYLQTELKRRKVGIGAAIERLNISKQTFYNKVRSSNQDPKFWSKVKNEFDIDPPAGSLPEIIKPKGEVHSTGSNRLKKEGLVPFYNADYIAGNAELYYEDETIYPEYYMDVPEFSGSTAFRAYGDSMEPKIKSGNILFGTKKDNWRIFLDYGQIYGVTCIDGSRFLKYVRKHPNKDMLLLKSENPNYDDIDMPKDQIKNLWLINGWIDKRT